MKNEQMLNITSMVKEGTGRMPGKLICMYELRGDSYPIKTDDVWKNWFMFAFEAFKRIATDKGHPVETFAAIGTGPGADAIGAMYTFDGLKRVVITDLDRKIVRLAEKNVNMNAPPGLEISAYTGRVPMKRREPLRMRRPWPSTP